MSALFVVVALSISQSNLEPPKCNQIVNGKGNIAIGLPCCINVFKVKECLVRDVTADVRFTKLSGVAAEAWKDSVRRIDSLYRYTDSVYQAEKILQDSLAAAEEVRAEKAREVRRKAAWRAAQKKRMESLRGKGWDERTINAIQGKKVFIGMTSEQAMESWGRPEDINRTINAAGTSEQWVYGGGSYLYFDNGILATIQN